MEQAERKSVIYLAYATQDYQDNGVDPKTKRKVWVSPHKIIAKTLVCELSKSCRAFRKGESHIAVVSVGCPGVKFISEEIIGIDKMNDERFENIGARYDPIFCSDGKIYIDESEIENIW